MTLTEEQAASLGPHIIAAPDAAHEIERLTGVDVLVVPECPPGTIYGVSPEFWEHVKAHGIWAPYPPEDE